MSATNWRTDADLAIDEQSDSMLVVMSAFIVG